MPSRFFEEFEIGEEFVTAGRTVTEADLVNYAGLSGNFHPIHLDEQFASKTPFGRRIAHGLLTLSLVLGLWDRLGLTEASVVAHAGMSDVRFLKPVYVGDTIHARIRVVDKQDTKPDHGLLVLEATAVNHRNEEVVVCINQLAVLKRKGDNH